MQRLRSPVREAFSYRLWHISSCFNGVSSYASLNHTGICSIPSENALRTGLRNLCNVFARSLRRGILAVTALLTFLSGVFILAAEAKISCFISLGCFKIKSNGVCAFYIMFYCYFSNGAIVPIFSDESKFPFACVRRMTRSYIAGYVFDRG